MVHLLLKGSLVSGLQTCLSATTVKCRIVCSDFDGDLLSCRALSSAHHHDCGEVYAKSRYRVHVHAHAGL
jgi:hypothetical protein